MLSLKKKLTISENADNGLVIGTDDYEELTDKSGKEMMEGFIRNTTKVAMICQNYHPSKWTSEIVIQLTRYGE